MIWSQISCWHSHLHKFGWNLYIGCFLPNHESYTSVIAHSTLLQTFTKVVKWTMIIFATFPHHFLEPTNGLWETVDKSPAQVGVADITTTWENDKLWPPCDVACLIYFSMQYEMMSCEIYDHDQPILYFNHFQAAQYIISAQNITRFSEKNYWA